MNPWVRIGIGIPGMLAAVMLELLFSQSGLFQWQLVIFLRLLEASSLFFAASRVPDDRSGAPASPWTTRSQVMTEAEWLACTDPTLMLEFLRDKVSDRKLRLFAVACCRRVSCCWSKDPQRTLLEMVELFADGLTTWESVRAWSNYNADECPVLDAAAEAGPYLPSLVIRSSQLASCWVADPVGSQRGTSAFYARAFAERSSQARIVGCVFGNPFRPVTIDLSWLAHNDGTVVKLAHAIYADRAFDRMPILADALEDAGCQDAEILDHCRGPGPHVLGCWVIDLLTGRS